MKISAPKENYIFIELTGDDMKKLNITYDEMDYSNVETRRVIWTLLDEARNSLGKRFELSDEMKIEALPSTDGGCLLFFTVNRKPIRYKLKSRNSSLAYRFDDIDSVLDLARSVTDSDKKLFKSDLYRTDNGYIITLYGKIRHSAAMKFIEYADPVFQSEREIECRENCLIRDNALDRLGFVSQ